MRAAAEIADLQGSDTVAQGTVAQRFGAVHEVDLARGAGGRAGYSGGQRDRLTRVRRIRTRSQLRSTGGFVHYLADRRGCAPVVVRISGILCRYIPGRYAES